MNKFAAEMDARGWSADYVAEALDVDVVTVRRWKNGDRRPRWEQFPAIRALFDNRVTAADFEPAVPRGAPATPLAASDEQHLPQVAA